MQDKFRSTDNLDFNKFITSKAKMYVEDSCKELNRRGLKITELEKSKLVDVLKNKKGLTVHIYTAGRITESDVKDLRPKEEKKEEAVSAK